MYYNIKIKINIINFLFTLYSIITSEKRLRLRGLSDINKFNVFNLQKMLNIHVSWTSYLETIGISLCAIFLDDVY